MRRSAIKISFWVLLFSAIAILYSPLLRNESATFIGIDDRLLVNDMLPITSVSSYVDAWKNHQIVDIQPVRDLSYAIDQKLAGPSGARYHLTNVLIWIAILLTFDSILVLLEVPEFHRYALVSVLSLHPAMTATVSWIASRKHLLAAFFAILATRQLIARKLVAVPLLYLLSIFSQPITLLWAPWAVIQVGIKNILKNKKLLFVFLLCAVISVFGYFVNSWFYSTAYLVQNGRDKYVAVESGGLALRMLSIGRYFFDVVDPSWVSLPDHDPGSIQGLIGLILMPVFGLLIIRRNSWTWMLLFFAALAPVLLKLTNIFCSDTYLVTPCFAIFVALALAMRNLRAKPILLASFGICIWFFYLSTQQVQAFTSNTAFWTFAVTRESSPGNLRGYSVTVLNQKRYDEALRLGEDMLKESGLSSPVAGLLISKSIYFKNGLTTSEKISKLLSYHLDSPWYHYYLAALYAAQSDFSEAHRILSKSILADPTFFVLSTVDYVEVIGAEEVFFCEKAGGADCESFKEILSSHCFGQHLWNDFLYGKRRAELTSPRETAAKK